MKHDEFKKTVEAVTARDFLQAYNNLFCTNYQVVPSEDIVPDVYCEDATSGTRLNLEVTLATRSLDGPLIWKKMLAGDYKPSGPFILDVQGELDAYKINIMKKMSKRYGGNTALVAFQWDKIMPWDRPVGVWKTHLDYFKAMLDFSESRYDKGVWMTSCRDLFRLD